MFSGGNKGCFQGAIEGVFTGQLRVFSGGNKGCFQREQ